MGTDQKDRMARAIVRDYIVDHLDKSDPEELKDFSTFISLEG